MASVLPRGSCGCAWEAGWGRGRQAGGAAQPWGGRVRVSSAVQPAAGCPSRGLVVGRLWVGTLSCLGVTSVCGGKDRLQGGGHRGMVTILAGGREDSWAGPPWKEGSQDRPPSRCDLG